MNKCTDARVVNRVDCKSIIRRFDSYSVLYAPVAQLDRATGFYPVGYVFESHREYNGIL